MSESFLPVPQHSLVLLISNHKNVIKKIETVFENAFPEAELIVAKTGAEGLNRLYQHPPGLVIVDGTLADMSGVQLCRVLKHDNTISKIPVLLINKEDYAEYERLTELSLVADMFLPFEEIPRQLAKQIRLLMRLFEGLDDAELQQINLIKQSMIHMEATNRLIQLLDQSITEGHIMKRFRKLFNLIQDRAVLIHMTFSLLENLLDYDLAGLFFNDSTRTPRKLIFHLRKDAYVTETQWHKFTKDVFDNLRTQTQDNYQFQSTTYEVLNSELPKEGKPLSLKHMLVYPFFSENTLVGALVFINRRAIHYEIIFPFQLVLQELSALMRASRYYSEAQMLAITDVLSGLYSFQYLVVQLEREILEAKRHQVPLTLVQISIDQFRSLNHDYGYPVGDLAIKKVAQMALHSLRNVDYVARSSGSRFLAVLPNTSMQSALTAVERLQKMVGEKPLIWQEQEIFITITAGLVELTPDIANSSDFIDHAQKALDAARRKGHNCLEMLH